MVMCIDAKREGSSSCQRDSGGITVLPPLPETAPSPGKAPYLWLNHRCKTEGEEGGTTPLAKNSSGCAPWRRADRRWATLPLVQVPGFRLCPRPHPAWEGCCSPGPRSGSKESGAPSPPGSPRGSGPGAAVGEGPCGAPPSRYSGLGSAAGAGPVARRRPGTPAPGMKGRAPPTAVRCHRRHRCPWQQPAAAHQTQAQPPQARAPEV